MVEKLEWGADDLALMNQYGKRDSADWVWFQIEVRKELVNHLDKAILQQHLAIARRNILHYDLTYVSTTKRWDQQSRIADPDVPRWARKEKSCSSGDPYYGPPDPFAVEKKNDKRVRIEDERDSDIMPDVDQFFSNGTASYCDAEQFDDWRRQVLAEGEKLHSIPQLVTLALP